MGEIRLGNILAPPAEPTIDAWIKAWSSACTGLACNGISVGFWNSVRILIPSVIVSILAGALTGYAMTFYKVRGAGLLFAILIVGAFIPYQVFLYPLVRILSTVGLYDSLASIVIIHVVFGLPLMTLLFRNYYSALPIELFNAARVDGAGCRSSAPSSCPCRRRSSSSRRSCRSPASGTISSSASPSRGATTGR
jgi:glucose/mannose transport system permease protein